MLGKWLLFGTVTFVNSASVQWFQLNLDDLIFQLLFNVIVTSKKWALLQIFFLFLFFFIWMLGNTSRCCFWHCRSRGIFSIMPLCWVSCDPAVFPVTRLCFLWPSCVSCAGYLVSSMHTGGPFRTETTMATEFKPRFTQFNRFSRFSQFVWQF